MAATSTIVFPGQELGPVGTALPGPGTHVENDRIFSSLTGRFTTLPPPSSPAVATGSKPATAAGATPLPTFTVAAVPSARSKLVTWRRPMAPSINSVVLGKVIRLSARQASISIVAIEAVDPDSGETTFFPCLSAFPALLRVQDIRATEKDKVKMLESLHVGDIVKALVISLGDQASYYLSTARNDLGVVMAWTAAETEESALGEQLLPISWNEMMAAQSGKREHRKVAKPL